MENRQKNLQNAYLFLQGEDKITLFGISHMLSTTHI
jgi:hypothetical protein